MPGNFGQKLQNIARDCIEYVLGYTVIRLDYQLLFGKGARAPPLFSGRVDQTRESGGNRAYTVMQMRKTNRGATFQVPRAS